MLGSRFLRSVAFTAALAAIYFVAGKLGLRLAFLHASATLVWPPTGISLAAFLLLGYRVWPAILLGAFLVNLTTAGTAATSLGIAVGNTLEGFLGAYWVNRFAHGARVFERGHDVFKFVFLAGMLSTAVSATVGVSSLALGGFADWSDYGSIWLTWWLGDAAGALVVAPLLILWRVGPPLRWSGARVAEAALLLLCLCGVGQLVFGGLLPFAGSNYPLSYLSLLPLLWVAFRFRPRETAVALAVLAAIAIRGTLYGLGPFARDTPNQSLLLLQAFMGIVAAMGLALAAVVAERREMEKILWQEAATDSLTGLANHRRFTQVLEEEIKRSRRTGRPFAVLLFDLNGLKRINDTQGHLVGNQALCRLAGVLRLHCREIDTAARVGGDEFAVVLVETAEPAAQRVTRRIAEGLASHPEQPALSVSTGLAVYPQDGEQGERLLQVADARLYEMKRGAVTCLGLEP